MVVEALDAHVAKQAVARSSCLFDAAVGADLRGLVRSEQLVHVVKLAKRGHFKGGMGLHLVGSTDILV